MTVLKIFNNPRTFKTKFTVIKQITYLKMDISMKGATDFTWNPQNHMIQQ